MVLKMFKMLQIPLSCKRYTIHSDDAKLKWHCHTLHWTTPMFWLRIYISKRWTSFFFFFFWKTKCTSRFFFFPESLAAWLWQKQAYQSTHSISVSPVQSNSCQTARVAVFGFCTKQPATLAYSNRDWVQNVDKLTFVIESWLKDGVEIKEQGV